MKATCDISLYPFSDDYKQVIIGFVQRLKKNKKLTVETNGMSTQVFGDYDLIMNTLHKEIKSTLDTDKCAFVFKIARGERTIKKLPKALQAK